MFEMKVLETGLARLGQCGVKMQVLYAGLTMSQARFVQFGLWTLRSQCCKLNPVGLLAYMWLFRFCKYIQHVG